MMPMFDRNLKLIFNGSKGYWLGFLEPFVFLSLMLSSSLISEAFGLLLSFDSSLSIVSCKDFALLGLPRKTIDTPEFIKK